MRAPCVHSRRSLACPLSSRLTTRRCASAWNDNGFDGLVRLPKTLHRTQWFPGLGWLLTRNLYTAELEPRWPSTHWDHWMRSERVHRTSRGRECLYPQMPRTYHHGALGTFMDHDLHSRYFETIALSADASLRWPAKEWPALRTALGGGSGGGYERGLTDTLAASSPLVDLRDLDRPADANASALALWYWQKPRGGPQEGDPYLFRTMAEFFGIWHEPRRGGHNGVHDFWCGQRRVLMINLCGYGDGKPSPYTKYAPKPDKRPRRKREPGEGLGANVWVSSAAFSKAVSKTCPKGRKGCRRKAACRRASSG